jgi:hypothetical protein
MKRLLIALVASLLITSPAWAHQKEISGEALAALKPGVATYPDVVAALGRPSSETFDSSGVRTIAYSTTRMHIKAATFIPYVGLFAGGATSDVSVVTLSFGADGRLLNYQSATSQTDCSSNVLGAHCSGGGLPAAPPPSQHPVALTTPPAAVATSPVPEPQTPPAAATPSAPPPTAG